MFDEKLQNHESSVHNCTTQNENITCFRKINLQHRLLCPKVVRDILVENGFTINVNLNNSLLFKKINITAPMKGLKYLRLTPKRILKRPEFIQENRQLIYKSNT